MFGLGMSAVTNIAQTLGAIVCAGLVQRGYVSADQVQTGIGALGTLLLLGFNVANHRSALAAPPPATGVAGQ